MTGNPAAGFYASVAYGIALVYGFTIINIPIGLFGGFYCLFRHPWVEKDAKEKNMRLCRASFISMIPIFGPVCAVTHLAY